MSSSLLLSPAPWLQSLKGLLFPPVCLLCHRFLGLSATETVCVSCNRGLERPSVGSNEILERDPSSEPLENAFSLYRYGRMARRLVHRIKMTGDPRAGVWLEAELRRTRPALASVDAIVPIPSHRRSAPVTFGTEPSPWSEALAAFLQVPIRRGLVRTQTVPKQTSLSRDRRLRMPESSLAVDARALRECRSVLLADDVFTTGATARACARVLSRHGIRHVSLAVIARG